MLTRALAVLFLVIGTTSCTMWKTPAKGWTGATGSETIERLFWNDVVNKDFAKVDAHLASSFTGSGSAGPVDRAAFLDQLRSAGITGVSLSDCATRLNGADLMIACKAQFEGTRPERVSTLSVWQEYKKGWLLVAHSQAPLNPQ